MKIALALREFVSDETIDNLNRNGSSTYVVDQDLRLAFMNDAWDRFALENDGDHITSDWPLMRCVLDAIPEPLKAFYSGFYSKILGGDLLMHEYECSSPNLYRKYKMIGYPLRVNQFVLIDNTLLVESEIRDGVELVDEEIEKHYFGKEKNALVQCCHCRRLRHVEIRDRWDFVPAVLKESKWPISHGLCNPCLEFYYPEE